MRLQIPFLGYQNRRKTPGFNYGECQHGRQWLVLQESFWEFSKLTGRNIGSSYTKDDAEGALNGFAEPAPYVDRNRF